MCRNLDAQLKQAAPSMHVLPSFCRSTSGLQRQGQGLGLFFTAHLQCPILFLDTLSFPTDIRAPFPNSHFNEMAPEMLLRVSPGEPAFSSTCSKKDSWTRHSSDSPLGWLSPCFKGIAADATGNRLQTRVTHSHAGEKKGFEPQIPSNINPGQANQLIQHPP